MSVSSPTAAFIRTIDVLTNLTNPVSLLVLSSRVMNRKQMLGKPDQRDLNENLAATHGLAHMIQECRKLFRVCVKELVWFDSVCPVRVVCVG